MSEWPSNPNHCYNCGREDPAPEFTAKLEADLMVLHKKYGEVCARNAELQNDVAQFKLTESTKLAAQSALISQMREALESINDWCGSISVVPVHINVVIEIANKVHKEAQEALALSAAEPAPEGKK